MPLYEEQANETNSKKICYFCVLMPASGLDFSAKSDKTVLGSALAEFQLLQPLTEGLSPLSSRGSSLLAVRSETEGTCNLT